MAPKTLISLNRWLRRNFQGNHPLKSITMNNSFQHSQQERGKSQAIWGSYSQHNKRSSSPSSSLEGSVLGIHRKGNRQRCSRKARAALCMTGVATCTEQDARRQGERQNRGQDASRHQGPREAGTQLGGERHLWHSRWLQPDSSFFLSTQHKQRSKPNEQSSATCRVPYQGLLWRR